jgi:hypothetical protein
MNRRPEPTEHAPYFSHYIELVPETDILSALSKQAVETRAVLSAARDPSFRYAPGKWTIKQVVGHMGDVERIFAYRALSIARGEKKALPGFDEDSYVRGADFDSWPYSDLVDALGVIRGANVLMFRHLPPEAWDYRGIASENPASVRALAYVILGHERHHLQILRERY